MFILESTEKSKKKLKTSVIPPSRNIYIQKCYILIHIPLQSLPITEDNFFIKLSNILYIILLPEFSN